MIARLHPYLIVDVFTDTPLAGNQLAVFTDGRPLSPGTMQRLAREMNLAESVFLTDGEDGAHFQIRIFTPTRELPFAGHPILGAAAIAATTLGIDGVRLETGSGVIDVAVERGDPLFAHLDQPAPPWEGYRHAPELLRALGVARSTLPVDSCRNGPLHAFVGLETPDQVVALEPELGALAALPELAATCFAPAGGQWMTRTFAPANGVAEDAATGSAAGPLALHLARHGAIAFGEEITIRQGAEVARPSTMYARAEGPHRLRVGGAAVVAASGHMRVPDEQPETIR